MVSDILKMQSRIEVEFLGSNPHLAPSVAARWVMLHTTAVNLLVRAVMKMRIHILIVDNVQGDGLISTLRSFSRKASSSDDLVCEVSQ